MAALKASADEGSLPIVNGTTTSAYPTSGVLILYGDRDQTIVDGMCSGTLIGCRTFLTAGHCVCPDTADDAATCQREGIVDPATVRVFLQNAGFCQVESVALDPDYVFAESGDVAVLTLHDPVTGIAPSAINTTARPTSNTPGTIVGFGRSGGGARDVDDSGIKREGTVTLATCQAPIPNATHLCWEFLGTQSSTCSGDSGGSLFVDLGAGPVLAGVTSGGNSFACRPPDLSFDADVFVNRAWITSQAGADLGAGGCGDLPVVGQDGVQVFESAGVLDDTNPQLTMAFPVPDRTRRLRIAINGQFLGGSRFSRTDNDFNLLAKIGAPPTDSEFDCRDNTLGPFGFCELTDPPAGSCHIVVDRAVGEGAVQVTATAFAGSAPPSPPCIGDCDADGVVTIDDLLRGVAIALGASDLDSCAAFDANADGVVTVDEILTALNSALGFCPSP